MRFDFGASADSLGRPGHTRWCRSAVNRARRWVRASPTHPHSGHTTWTGRGRGNFTIPCLYPAVSRSCLDGGSPTWRAARTLITPPVPLHTSLLTESAGPAAHPLTDRAIRLQERYLRHGPSEADYDDEGQL
jgi:hypothetical protein